MSRPALDDLLQHTAALRHLARSLVGEARADDVMQETAIGHDPGTWVTLVSGHMGDTRAARTRPAEASARRAR